MVNDKNNCYKQKEMLKNEKKYRKTNRNGKKMKRNSGQWKGTVKTKKKLMKRKRNGEK